ncbi:outer membrane beta-barrel protein [Gayadomonas joobiniege]|uniref:outer membrane beta-barrel protein n=1 Tax=Gayadomonas joobiniege TaxID=1234606 RepID=UPI00035F9942|nr:outer membrane beta-barrel protein [Gayadomonas joobiniege]
MLNKTMASLVLALSSFSASAAWVGGIDYTYFSNDVEDSDVSVDAVTASLGYKMPIQNGFSIMPEVRLGTGVGNDNLVIGDTDTEVELDMYKAVALRAQFETDSGFYAFVAPSYSQAEYEYDFAGNTIEWDGQDDDDWEAGLGAGIGMQFTSASAVELKYEEIDEVEVASIGLKFGF